MNDVAGGQYSISIVLQLEFSPSVLSRLASSLFTFGGQAVSPLSRSETRLCREWRRHFELSRETAELKLTHAVLHELVNEAGPVLTHRMTYPNTIVNLNHIFFCMFQTCRMGQHNNNNGNDDDNDNNDNNNYYNNDNILFKGWSSNHIFLKRPKNILWKTEIYFSYLQIKCLVLLTSFFTRKQLRHSTVTPVSHPGSEAEGYYCVQRSSSGTRTTDSEQLSHCFKLQCVKALG